MHCIILLNCKELKKNAKNLLLNRKLKGVSGVFDVILALGVIGICHIMVPDFQN